MFECRTGLDPVLKLGLLVVWRVVLRLFGEKKTKIIKEVIFYELQNNSTVTVIFRWSGALHMMQKWHCDAPALRSVHTLFHMHYFTPYFTPSHLALFFVTVK